MNNIKKICLSILFCNLLISNTLIAALPENISQLVDESAPAVVNVTSKKEITQTNKHIYTDLVFENEDNEFVDWVENLQENGYIDNQTYKKLVDKKISLNKTTKVSLDQFMS